MNTTPLKRAAFSQTPPSEEDVPHPSGDEQLKAAIHRLARSALKDLPAANDDSTGGTPELRRQLLDALTAAFTLEDLKTLCFEMGIDGEATAGAEANKVVFARELIAYCERQRQLSRLIEAALRARPNLTLPRI